MSDVLDALGTFLDHLRAVDWTFAGLAVACHAAKVLARTRAWRNILAAAYPDRNVRWRSVFGAYAAGAGVNAVIPARGGDLLRLFILKRRIPDATYPTLGATLLVDSIVDVILSTSLVIWALAAGILPGVNVLHNLPSIDWFWLFEHPKLAIGVIAGLLVASFVAGVWAARRIEEFRRRVAQGFSILQTPARYLRRVAAFEVLDWAFRMATICFFLHAFHVPATLGNVLRVQMTQSLATVVPLTPAGVGTEQALIVYVLRGQATKTALLSLSVGMKSFIVAFNVTIGVLALFVMLRTLHWRRLVEGEAAARGSARPPA